MTSPLKIDQRYEIIKSLGGGLSGEVMLVRDPAGHQAALKFLKKVQMNVSRDEALQNFKNEFSILKELNHPNIARILDFGYDPKIQKYYYTCEFIEGADFCTACENQPVHIVEKLIVQVLRALNYLHSRSIYHFDIKPQNILVSMKNGIPLTAKIIDFGLAGFATPRKKVGTPSFMAPEVIQGGVLDQRTDLYSTGVLIYKALTGINPFVAKNLGDTLKNQQTLMPKPPTQVNPNAPAYWDHIAGRLLEKDPVHRYSQASLVILDLNYLSNKKFEVETRDTKLSYLPEKGTLIGREEPWQAFTKIFSEIFTSDEMSDHKLLIIEGQKGCGKTRLLSEMKYFSQLRNIPTPSLGRLNREQYADGFLLLIDAEEADANRVNALVQELFPLKCLIVWATELAPKNWANTRVIQLKNYDKMQLKQYLESVTGLGSAPERLIDAVYNRTQGNPLFVTEFIKSLLDQNVLFDSSGKWDAKTFEDIKIDFDKIHIPSSMEDYLSARYKSLDNGPKEVLNWLAVHHQSTPIEILTAVIAGENVHKDILTLIQEDILGKTAREHTYYFKNHLMADVIYKHIPAYELPRYHEQLALIFKDKKDGHKEFLRHKGLGTDPAAAKSALFDLGTIYMDEPDYEKAIQNFKKLIAISDDPFGEREIEARFRLGEAYTAIKQYAAAEETYHALKEEFRTKHDESSLDKLIRTHVRLMDVCLKKSELETAVQYYQEVQDALEKSPQKKTYQLIFDNYWGYILLKQGKVDEAEKTFEKNHKIWSTELGQEEKQMVDNNRLVEVYLFKQQYEKAIQLCEQNIAILNKSGNKYLLAVTHYALGDVYYRLITAKKLPDRSNAVKKCMATFEECEKLARQIGNYGLMFRAFNGLGNLCAHEQQNDRALDYYNRALAVARQSEDMFNAALISYNIGSIHLNEDRTRDAYTCLIYCINTLQNLHDVHAAVAEQNLLLAYISLAEVHYKNREYQKAHEAMDKADELFSGRDVLKMWEYWKDIRRAQIFYGEKNFEQGKIFLKKAKALAKSEEEQNDLTRAMQLIEADQSGLANIKDKKEPAMSVLNTSLSHSSSGDELKKIIEINNLINSEYDTEQLLKLVLNYAIQLSSAEAGFVLLLDDSGELKIKASMNVNKTDEEKLSLSIAGMALEKGEIITSSDALSDERFDSSESIVLGELKSVVCLPIRSKNKSIGVFYLDNRFRTSAFENCNVNLLTAYCDQVGIALENNKLIHELMQAKSRLQVKLDRTAEELEQVKDILKTESETYKTKYAYKNIIARSKPMQDIFKLLDKVTETTLSIFIHGPSGTGKELVARALHHNNPAREQNRFVAINCGAIPANLMESELFGYKAGSFTGANRDKKGLFEEAGGGTLFLDEISELDPQLQVKLLRVLQEGEVHRVGDTRTFKVDVRIVCASHKDMQKLAKEGLFREDLFYRLCQIKIDIPSLAERKEDIPLLAKHFAARFAKQNNLQKEIFIPPHVMKAFLEYDWPGNVRELDNLISVACALCDGAQLSLENIPPNYGIKQTATAVSPAQLTQNPADISSVLSHDVKIDSQNVFDASKTWQNYEAVILAKCFETHKKKKMPAAKALGLSHSTVYKKIEELNLDDDSNPLYADHFVYEEGTAMKDYIRKIFKAALTYHNNHPYAAIKQLNVSQGYFYKIMKEFKRDEIDATRVET